MRTSDCTAPVGSSLKDNARGSDEQHVRYWQWALDGVVAYTVTFNSAPGVASNRIANRYSGAHTTIRCARELRSRPEHQRRGLLVHVHQPSTHVRTAAKLTAQP